MKPSPQSAISDSEFADTFKASEATVKELVAESHPDSLLPILQVVSRDGFGKELAIHAFGLPDLPPDFEQRARIFRGIGQMVYSQRDKFGAPVAIVFVSEAWTLGKMSKEALEMFEQSGKSVSQHKSKKECVIVTGRTVDGRKALTMYDIVRQNGNIDQLKPFNFSEKAKDVDTILLDNFYKGVYDASNQERKEP